MCAICQRREYECLETLSSHQRTTQVAVILYEPCSYLSEVTGQDYLDPGEWLDDPDEVLLQQVIIQLGQVGADDGIIPQLCFVLC